MRPDLTFTSLRGNIATRLSKIPPGGAVVVAAAALLRLGLVADGVHMLDPSVMLPQVGQGAIAVECRPDDRPTLDALAAIDDATTRACVTEERAFLARFGGACDLPVGAYSHAPGSVEGLVASLDGRVVLRASATSGLQVAEDLLAAGGADLL
jgi:hydroxymethylbilane synthase